MSFHFKTLIQHTLLQPFLHHSNSTTTPKSQQQIQQTNRSSSIKKLKLSSVTKKKCAALSGGSDDDDSSETRSDESTTYQTPSKIKKLLHHSKDQMGDSGLETSSSNTYYQLLTNTSSKIVRSNKNKPTVSCKCQECLTRLNRANRILKRLKQSYSNYVNSNYDQSKFANIPVLIIRSFKPSLNTTKSSDNLNKIPVRKGSAVNALFISENKQWIYVKTSNEVIGFIPKKCCEPFFIEKCCMHVTKSKKSINFDQVKLPPKIEPPPVPVTIKKKSSNHTILQDHTYMTIADQLLDNNKQMIYENEQIEEEDTDLSLFSVSQMEENMSMKQRTSLLLCNSNHINNNSEDDEYLNLAGSPTASSICSESTCCYQDLANFVSQKKQNNNNRTPKTHEDYDFLSSARSSSSKKIKRKSIYSCSQSSANYQSLKKSINKRKLLLANDYDDLVSVSCNNNNINKNNLTNHYDVLMTYKSTYNKSPNNNNYYNVSSSINNNNNSQNLYKIVQDYQTDYKEELSVKKGDLVYLIENSNFSSKHDDDDKISNDWLYVRLYKRSIRMPNQNNYENCLFDGSLNNRNYSTKLQGFIPRNCVVKV